MRILIVEDEIRLAEALGQIMEENKYTADIVHDGEAGLDYALSGIYDVIVLDVMLPKRNGFDIVRELRAQKDQTPVLLLTAKDEVQDKVTGLDCGADDYLTKPFNSKELFARIRALLRERRQLENQERYLHLREMTVFVDRHEAVIGPRKIRFSKTEFELLVYLILNKNIVLSRSRILEEVWGYGFAGDTNIVDVYIRYLRGKLGPDYRNYIRTVRGVGYVAED